MGYKHDQGEFLAAAVAMATEDGISRLSFGRLAKRLGVQDRNIVYYFPTKAELVAAVVGSLAGDLLALLEDAFGDQPISERDVLARAWPLLASPAADPAFDVAFEIFGLASSGQEPFADLAPRLMAGWIGWLEPRLDLPDDADRTTAALGVFAVLDGLLMMRRIVGADAAERAASHLGIATPEP